MHVVRRAAPHKLLSLALVILAAAALAGRAAPAAFASGRVAAGVREADPPVQTPSVSITGKVTTGSRPSWLDYVPVAGFAAALLTLWVIWGQLKSTDRTARRERAAETAAAWMDRDFRQIASAVIGFLELQDVDDCLRKVRAWVSAPNSEELCLPGASRTPTVRRNDVGHVLGVIEDIAVRYNTKAADREWIELLLGANLVRMFDTAMWFVVFFRAWEESPTMNTELEDMVRGLREASNASILRSRRLIRNVRLVRKRHRQTKQGTYKEINEFVLSTSVSSVCLRNLIPRRTKRGQKQAASLPVSLEVHRFPAYIDPGSPWQNPFVESFHSRVRGELLGVGGCLLPGRSQGRDLRSRCSM